MDKNERTTRSRFDYKIFAQLDVPSMPRVVLRCTEPSRIWSSFMPAQISPIIPHRNPPHPILSDPSNPFQPIRIDYGVDPSRKPGGRAIHHIPGASAHSYRLTGSAVLLHSVEHTRACNCRRLPPSAHPPVNSHPKRPSPWNMNRRIESRLYCRLYIKKSSSLAVSFKDRAVGRPSRSSQQ